MYWNESNEVNYEYIRNILQYFIYPLWQSESTVEEEEGLCPSSPQQLSRSISFQSNFLLSTGGLKNRPVNQTPRPGRRRPTGVSNVHRGELMSLFPKSSLWNIGRATSIAEKEDRREFWRKAMFNTKVWSKGGEFTSDECEFISCQSAAHHLACSCCPNLTHFHN